MINAEVLSSSGVEVRCSRTILVAPQESLSYLTRAVSPFARGIGDAKK